jgi:hypothetical protein
MPNTKIPHDLQLWIAARRRHKLSHAQVQMARELGMNPRKLGHLDNHKLEPWKMPLPLYIEKLYLRRFGKAAPETVVSIEDRAKQLAEKKAKRRAAKAKRRSTDQSPATQNSRPGAAVGDDTESAAVSPPPPGLPGEQ